MECNRAGRTRTIVIALLAFLLGITCCYATLWIPSLFGYWLSGEGDEISRTTSPDGGLDAVVVERNPGAMSGFVYFLYIVPKAERVSYFRSDPPIVNTSRGSAIRAEWETLDRLDVETRGSHVRFFGSLWYSEKAPGRIVHLQLNPCRSSVQRTNLPQQL